LNRVDEIIRFTPLGRDDLRQIVEIQVAHLRRRLADRRIDLVVADGALDALAAEGYDPAFGARPLKRVIQRSIGDRVAVMILEGSAPEGSTLTVDGEVTEAPAPDDPDDPDATPAGAVTARLTLSIS